MLSKRWIVRPVDDAKQTLAQHADAVKHSLDGASIGITAGALMELLPAISAGLSILWLMIRIYETHTVQRILGRIDD